MKWGVVVAADKGAEWLLPWWWKNYSRYHQQPVVFIDFGMSKKAKTWCSSKGLLLPFAGSYDCVTSKESTAVAKQKKWEGTYGLQVWEARKSWFKKPLAMLQSPFQTTVWMDLDCEVCRPIDTIVEGIDAGVLGAVVVGEGRCNSGVVVYDKEAPLLKAWAKACGKKSSSHMGDETLLTQLICKKKYPFKELGQEFNWLMGWGYEPRLKIAHWAGMWGKLCIETIGGIHPLLDKQLI